jgi:hypothetical protein
MLRSTAFEMKNTFVHVGDSFEEVMPVRRIHSWPDLKRYFVEEPSKFYDQEHVLVFEPGEPGFTVEGKSGFVTSVDDYGQAQSNSLQVGWQIVEVDGQAYSESLLEHCWIGDAPCRVTFMEHVGSGARRHSVDTTQADTADGLSDYGIEDCCSPCHFLAYDNLMTPVLTSWIYADSPCGKVATMDPATPPSTSLTYSDSPCQEAVGMGSAAPPTKDTGRRELSLDVLLPAKPKTPLTSQAKPFSPVRLACSAVSEDDFVAAASEIGRAVQNSFLGGDFADRCQAVSVVGDASNQKIVVTIPKEHLNNVTKDEFLSYAARTYVDTVARSECSCPVLPVCQGGALITRSGDSLVATLGAAADKSRACWDFYNKGFCRRGCFCQWEHARWRSRIKVTVERSVFAAEDPTETD